MAQYYADDVNVVIDGVIATGFADGTYVTGERNEEKRELEVGAQGDVVMVEASDDTGTVSITLQQTSPTNDLLRGLYNSGEDFAISVDDPNDNTANIEGSECYVANLPSAEKDGSVTDREWEILVVDYEEA